MAREDVIEELRNYGKRDLLSALGIEMEGNWGDFLGPALGAFGVGCLVGAGLGLLFAPQAGRELRQGIRQKFTKGRGRAALPAEEAYPSGYERAAQQDVQGMHGPM
jgi:hypothetical protein